MFVRRLGEEMRHRALPEALFAFTVLYGSWALAGCQAAGRPGAEAVTQQEETRAPAGPGRTGVFLGQGTCAGRGRTAFTEVDCASGQATAAVLARYYGPQSGGPRCPGETDFVLHITAVDAGTSETDSVPEGYACMRNLLPPHPGDPGMGGGPLTVVGDCVYMERHGVVKETACDGSQEHAPEYRVRSEALRRADCPAGTDLYVQVGGGTPVGCARRLGTGEEP
ncbi:hypothetical protein GCM10010218_17120 [Streptomyces mashuensis]|uniref:Lipoprotein n=1 Tax=Streptomyces mashuensis TaxID=33904 RepID=A0A919B2E3_9ACTN|nr:hypothetical protein [Streptomyces mashuensis]GHF36188.1 hypothetical protein GCM10010218_17120 [Streptomyces mashuensis]